jgi:hypothetical protein
MGRVLAKMPQNDDTRTVCHQPRQSFNQTARAPPLGESALVQVFGRRDESSSRINHDTPYRHLPTGNNRQHPIRTAIINNSTSSKPHPRPQGPHLQVEESTVLPV